ncbi:hypothetical protein [Candidatus Thiosymbion oneisti]|uniref:hypothetical protein n=1 Tax=Candidatus Thiosymbion oneisti TaxID=589554 RepID=UPI0010616D92|nr:hypothetical protein [Candidatus Thiosymbion oneisti]
MQIHATERQATKSCLQNGTTKAIYAAFFLFLWMIDLSANVQPHKIGYVFNQDLLHMQRNYGESLDLQRSELQFASGSSATNCLEYYRLSSEQEIDESIHNQLVKSEYLVCDALKILAEAAVVHEGSATGRGIGEKLSSKLDLRSFPSSLFRISDEEKHTLSALYPKNNLVSDDTATLLETKDWIFRLEVVAIVPLNDNKIPDWVIWVSDEAKQGSYRSYSTLIIYDPATQESLVATPYLSELKG